jgi:predicted secreted protein
VKHTDPYEQERLLYPNFNYSGGDWGDVDTARKESARDITKSSNVRVQSPDIAPKSSEDSPVPQI